MRAKKKLAEIKKALDEMKENIGELPNNDPDAFEKWEENATAERRKFHWRVEDIFQL
jgi:hypothetical protein